MLQVKQNNKQRISLLSQQTLINSFVKKRLIELSGVLLILIGFFLLTSIATYSPSDPNFIYTPENTEIKKAENLETSEDIQN